MKKQFTEPILLLSALFLFIGMTGFSVFAKPTLRAEQHECTIMNGVSCKVNLLVSNPDRIVYGIWRQGTAKRVAMLATTNGEKAIEVEIFPGLNTFEIWLAEKGTGEKASSTPIPGSEATDTVIGRQAEQGATTTLVSPTTILVTTTPSTSTSTSSSTTSSSIPSTTGLKFTVDKNLCLIPIGESRCSVKLTVENPNHLSLVIDRVHPQEGRKTITGTITDSMEIQFDWVTVGTFTFILNDPSAQKDYASVTVIGQYASPASTTTTSTLPSSPTLTSDKSVCVIPAGQVRCSIKLTVYNPGNYPLVIDRVHPQEGRKTFTGVITATTSEVQFDWVTIGTFSFILNNPSTGIDYSTVMVIGQSDAANTTTTTSTTLPSKPKLTADKTTCLIPEGAVRCSVKLMVQNPQKQPLIIERVTDQDSRMTITGVITDTYAEIQFEWVTASLFIFILTDSTTKTEYDYVLVTGQSSTPTTVVTTSTTTTTIASIPKITANKSSCTIAPGDTRCSVLLSVSNNLNRLPLKVDRIHPNPSEARMAITGEFTDANFQFTFDWITPGAFTFVLYQSRTGQEYSRTVVNGFASTQSGASRSISGKTITLSLLIQSEVASFAVEETLPVIPGSISDSGKWDAINQKIKWGPFRNTGTGRVLSYQACGSGSIAGTACFDGSCTSISGPGTLNPCSSTK